MGNGNGVVFEFHSVRHPLCTCGRHDALEGAVVTEAGGNIPRLFALYPNVCLRPGFSCITISEPAGAIGVESKWYLTSMATHAESSGFCLHLRTMLTLRSICGSSLHQSAMGNVGGSEAMVDLMHDL